MGRLRSVAILALFAALILGQTYAVATRSEPWPFSDYPMYANNQGPHVSVVRVEGRTAAGEVYVLSLREDLMPFDPSRLLGFLRRVGRGARSNERREGATRALLALYEQNRSAGRHAGPRLESLSVYEERYRVVPGAKNRDRPERRKLVASSRNGTLPP